MRTEADGQGTNSESAPGLPQDYRGHLEGMKAYGPDHPDYPNAPSDWDGGPYRCRDGKLYHMRGYGWGHGINCWNETAAWDRVAYTPTPESEIARLGGEA